MTKRNHDLLRDLLDELLHHADPHRSLRALQHLDQEPVALRPRLATRGRCRELPPGVVRRRGLVSQSSATGDADVGAHDRGDGAPGELFATGSEMTCRVVRKMAQAPAAFIALVERSRKISGNGE